MEKFREALKHSDTVLTVLTGVGEMCFSSEEISNYIDELERLAEIGRATEKAFEKQTVLLIHYRLWDGSYEGEYEFEEIEELLEWHRKQEAE